MCCGGVVAVRMGCKVIGDGERKGLFCGSMCSTKRQTGRE